MKFVRRFVIWAFKLDDIKQLCVDERMRQRKRDEEEFSEKLKIEIDRHEQEISLNQQVHEAEIIMITQELTHYKNREKELTQREYKVKRQTEANTANAVGLFSHIFNVANYFQKEAAEIQKYLDDVEIVNAKKLLK